MLSLPQFAPPSLAAFDLVPSPGSLLDMARRAVGIGLDAIGLGPVPTPSVIVERTSGMKLRAYHARSAPGPDLLIVPAPIKRPYVWDLMPPVSVVRRALQAGFRVWLVDWNETAHGDDFGLAHYAGSFPLAACDAIEAATGESRVLVAGHSLGGTLAAIFASLHPERVRGLVLVEAPLAFGRHRGPIGDFLAGMDGSTAAGIGLAGPVSGTLLSAAGVAAAPDDFVRQPLLDLYEVTSDPMRAAIHLRVLRWTFDEFPMPRRLLADIVEDLYRGDRYMGDTLRVGARRTGFSGLRVPTAAVVVPAAGVVPVASATHALATLPSNRRRVFEVKSERGAMLQHVAALVGPTAHATLWPPLLDWLKELRE